MGLTPISKAGLTKKSYLVTSADLVNAIVLSFTANIFYTRMESDPLLYDGNVKAQYLDETNTWQDVPAQVLSAPADFEGFDTTGTKQGSNWTNSFPPMNPKFPFQIRYIIVTKATQGSVVIEADFV